MPTFTTTFTPPTAPSGFELAADLDLSAVVMTWDASAIAQVDFAGFRVYRSLDGGLTFDLLQILPLVSDVTYSDFEAPLNADLVYRLTQSNLDFESDPVDGSIMLASSQWHIVVPGDADLTFGIPKLRAASLTSPKVDDVFSPLGRPGKMVIGDTVQTEDGEISFIAMPGNLGMVALLKAIQSRMEGGIILKATDGSVWPVQFQSMRRTFTSWAGQEISIPFVGVD